MGDTGPTRTSAPLGMVAIAVIVLGVAAVGYLVTTFLFAFSGGQYRMVAVVNLGAVAVISLGVLVAAVSGSCGRPPKRSSGRLSQPEAVGLRRSSPSGCFPSRWVPVRCSATPDR